MSDRPVRRQWVQTQPSGPWSESGSRICSRTPTYYRVLNNYLNINFGGSSSKNGSHNPILIINY